VRKALEPKLARMEVGFTCDMGLEIRRRPRTLWPLLSDREGTLRGKWEAAEEEVAWVGRRGEGEVVAEGKEEDSAEGNEEERGERGGLEECEEEDIGVIDDECIRWEVRERQGNGRSTFAGFKTEAKSEEPACPSRLCLISSMGSQCDMTKGLISAICTDIPSPPLLPELPTSSQRKLVPRLLPAEESHEENVSFNLNSA
jgi:hypothetical protein